MDWSVSPGAALLFAVLYFLDDTGLAAALVPAVAIHELGHLVVLRRCGAAPRGIRVTVFGFQLDYAGVLTPRQELLAAAAGPAAGLGYGLLAASFGGAFFRLSGGASVCLSCFNLLPVLPLDGGRMAAALWGERTAVALSGIVAGILALASLALFVRYHAAALPAMALWLLARNIPVTPSVPTRRRRR